MVRCRTTLAYLVLLRMEVASFPPRPAVTREPGLVSVALFVTSPCQGVTLHPALRSPDFPPRRITAAARRLPWPTPEAILRAGRAEIALVVVELGALVAGPPRVAEHRQWREVASPGAGW